MNILAIETTGQKASVAVIDEKNTIQEETCGETLNHLRFLMPMAENLLKKCELRIDDIDVIAVSEGPGSFTGIRIGMASAKALAQALKLDMICVPTLKSFSYHDTAFDGLICPIFDARRSQVYGGAYRWEKGSCKEAVADGAYDLKEFLLFAEQAALKNGCKVIRFYGDGIEPNRQLLDDWTEELLQELPEGSLSVEFASEEMRYQKASSVARLALDKWTSNQTQSLFTVKPVYLRKAEAERKLEESRKRQEAAEASGKTTGAYGDAVERKSQKLLNGIKGE